MMEAKIGIVDLESGRTIKQTTGKTPELSI